jgi:hypothetical protein
VPEAKLPPGSHKLIVEIGESMGRIAERVLQFAVEVRRLAQPRPLRGRPEPPHGRS